jgi:low density lipoprotein receptor-related protein 5/6
MCPFVFHLLYSLKFKFKQFLISLFSLIFWVNIASPIRIERSKVDGHERKVLVNSTLGEPSDLAVDTTDDLIFWADIKLKRIECSGLEGQNRRVIVENGIQGPILIAIQDRFIYWADRGLQAILRANKLTGKDKQIIKSRAQHLSALLSVLPKTTLDNPCLRADCSHLCLVDRKKNQARCSCPSGSGLVLNADDRTCGLPPTCKPAEFTCNSGSPACIPLQWRCDGQAECSDHSDEIGCPECGAKQFKCRNGGCVNGTLVCDGVKHCEDSSDELNCCPKEKFQCSLSGECIDADKTCNGVHDCSDSSDELVPQCNNIIGSSANSVNADASNSSTTITITLVTILFLAIVMAITFFVIRKNNSSSDNESNNPLSPSIETAGPSNGTLQRVTQMGAETKLVRTAGNGMAVNNNSTMEREEIASGVMSTANGGAIGGSSNGIAYDRSHVTGASSSTTSSSNFPRDFVNPPPSPATTVANRVSHQIHPASRQHQSMHSLPRSHRHRGRISNRPSNVRSNHHIHHPPPPPTPYSTDFNEESDYGIGMSGPHFPSAANSTHGGYESSDAYAEHLDYNHPPPSTPQYDSDYANEISYPASPTPEENTFFLTQPPPSPVPSAGALDEDEIN